MKYVGPLLIAFAAVHFVMGFVLFSDGFVEIIERGFFAGLSWSMEAHTFFWFQLLCWPLVMLGYVAHQNWSRFGDIPGPTGHGHPVDSRTYPVRPGSAHLRPLGLHSSGRSGADGQTEKASASCRLMKAI